MDLTIYFICIVITSALMILFVFINYPYYKMSHGEKAKRIVIRTIALNFVAILIGWGPVVFFWPMASLRYLLPLASIVGALGCVGSRFIYPEIVPKELAKTLVKLLEEKAKS